MRLVRFVSLTAFPVALMLGSLSGCESAANNTVSTTAVKEAPPMTPEQKAEWSKNYDPKKGRAPQQKTK